jgi:hypothetical protein
MLYVKYVGMHTAPTPGYNTVLPPKRSAGFQPAVSQTSSLRGAIRETSVRIPTLGARSAGQRIGNPRYSRLETGWKPALRSLPEFVANPGDSAVCHPPFAVLRHPDGSVRTGSITGSITRVAERTGIRLATRGLSKAVWRSQGCSRASQERNHHHDHQIQEVQEQEQSQQTNPANPRCGVFRSNLCL